MVVVTNSWRIWLVGMVVSVGIFAVIYFTVIQPSNNQANQALKSGLQQSAQSLKDAQKQISNATQGAGASTSAASGAASSAASGAQQQLNKAAKLSSCVAAAGLDPTKIQACKSQYGG